MKIIKFLRIASICSFLGAITTILLLYLPSAVADGFEAQAALHSNKLYITKLWILFFHPQLNFIATIGIAVLFFNKFPEIVIPALLLSFLYTVAEMAQQAFLIDAVNIYWRPGYLNEVDEIKRASFVTNLSSVEAIWESMYLIFQYGFALGSILIGFLLLKTKNYAKWIGISKIIIGISVVMAFLYNYMGVEPLLGSINWFYAWIYPVLQPAVRIAIGIWLWKQLTLINLQRPIII